MSISNCCFLTCIQFLRRQVRWSGIPISFSFPVCCDPHKGFNVVNEVEVDVFLEFSCFFYDPVDVGNLIPLPFLNPAWTSGSSWFIYYWSLAWRILSITLLACEMSAIVWYFEHSLALSFFGIGMKPDLFQSCGHCWVFQICWHIDCDTLTTSSFRTSDSSARIPSPPLALFVVMLLKVHLTLHPRMSGSSWVIRPSWLFGWLISFSMVLLCILATSSWYLLLLLGPYPFCLLLCPSLHEKFPLEKISSLSHSIVFFNSLHWLLWKTFLSLLDIIWNSAFRWVSFFFSFAFCFSSFSQLFVSPPQTIILPCCISFSWGWSWSPPPIRCHEPLSIVLQTLTWSYSSPPM